MKKLLGLILLLISFQLYAQESYIRSYGKEGDDAAYCLAINENKELLTVGLTKSFSSSKGLLLNKVDSLGNLIWSRSITAERNIIGKSVVTTRDGGYIISGNTNAVGAGKKDALLIKVAENGEIEWSKVYGGELHDYSFSVKQTLDDGYIVAGETNSFGVSGSDIYLFKVDRYGNVDWAKAFGSTNVEFGYAVHETLDGYIVASETNSYGAGGWDVSLLKLNKEGRISWFSTYGGLKDDFGYSIAVNDSLEIYMVGSTSSFGMGQRDIYLFQIDKGGEVVSARTLGDVYDEQAHKVEVLKDGGLAIVGFTNSYNQQMNAEDALLIRITKGMHLKWAKVFGGVQGDYGLDVVSDTLNNLYIAGETFNYHGRSDKDALVIKMPDNPKQSYCEQARVQVIPLHVDDELVVKRYDIGQRDIAPKVTNATFVNKQVLIYEHVICTDQNHLIDGNRRK